MSLYGQKINWGTRRNWYKNDASNAQKKRCNTWRKKIIEDTIYPSKRETIEHIFWSGLKSSSSDNCMIIEHEYGQRSGERRSFLLLMSYNRHECDSQIESVTRGKFSLATTWPAGVHMYLVLDAGSHAIAKIRVGVFPRNPGWAPQPGQRAELTTHLSEGVGRSRNLVTFDMTEFDQKFSQLRTKMRYLLSRSSRENIYPHSSGNIWVFKQHKLLCL